MCDALAAAGWDVWGIGYGAGDLEQPTSLSDYAACDLTDAGTLVEAVSRARPEAVLHLAAIAFVGHGDADDFYRINLIGTHNLLRAIECSGVKPRSVVLASSANIYGNGASGRISEEQLANPSNDYAVSKSAMEQMARLWFDRLPILLTRPFNYTGLGQSERFLIPKIVDHIRRQADVIELGNLDVARDFSDVRFVADVYRRLLESGHSGEAINICSGVARSLNEILMLVQEISGHSIEIRVNPDFVREKEVMTLCGDPSRLNTLIGPSDAPSLHDTLRWMIEAR